LPQPFGLAFHFDQKSLESCNLRDPSACGTILKVLRRKNSALARAVVTKMRTHYPDGAEMRDERGIIAAVYPLQ